MSDTPAENALPTGTVTPPVTLRPVDAAGHRENPTSPIGERIFRKLIEGRVFLIGVLIGFIVCCGGGWWQSRRMPFKHFLRFHHFINPQSQFYPTVSQMIETARADLKPDQILVIVGGDSVLFGTGQLAKDIWTIHLSELLGPKYKVVVLAYPGSAFSNVGAVVAEALTKQHYKVVVLSHMYLAHLNAIQDLVHPHVFWQAWERNLLMKDPRRAHAVEQAITAINVRGETPAEEARKAPLREMPLAYGIDAWLHFNDLWTAIGYSNFFTVWNSLTKDKFYMARKHFRDPEVPTPVEARNPPLKFIEGMALIRRTLDRLSTMGSDGHWQENPGEPFRWLALEDMALSSMPLEMRKRMIAILPYENPLYRNQLTADETEQYEIAVQGTLRRMNAASYDAVSVGKDFVADDYFDVLHFAPSGGAKMADVVAPEIVKVAKQLGYVP